MAKKINIKVAGLYNYDVTLTEPNALKFLKELRTKHLKMPSNVPPLRVSITTTKATY